MACLSLFQFAPPPFSPPSLSQFEALAPSPLCRKHSPFESAGRSLGEDGAASGDGRGRGAEGRNDFPGGDRGVSSSRGSLDRDGASLGDDGARRGDAAAGENGRARRDRGAGGGQHLVWKRRCGGRGEGGSGEKEEKQRRVGFKKVNFFGFFFSLACVRQSKFSISLSLFLSHSSFRKKKRKTKRGGRDMRVAAVSRPALGRLPREQVREGWEHASQRLGKLKKTNARESRKNESKRRERIETPARRRRRFGRLADPRPLSTSHPFSSLKSFSTTDSNKKNTGGTRGDCSSSSSAKRCCRSRGCRHREEPGATAAAAAAAAPNASPRLAAAAAAPAGSFSSPPPPPRRLLRPHCRRRLRPQPRRRGR